MLVGQWVADQIGDRKMVAKIAGRVYADVERMLVRWGAPVGPIVRRGATWDWRGVEYAWRSLVNRIDLDQLRRFTDTVVEVLTTSDPQFDLDPPKRWMVPIWGKVHPYSVFLRSGLVESVVHLAICNDAVADRSGQDIADGIVRALLGTDLSIVGQRFLLLADFLPDLAEASPESFLTSAERFSADVEVGKGLFVDTGPLSSSPHVHLLWALERLAWCEKYFTRVVLVLGNLAAIDPGGRLSNRPSESLTLLFLPWRPGTIVSIEHRLRAIDRLREQHPDVSWALAVSLLPDEMRLTHSTGEPQWRPWKPEGFETTGTEYWGFVEPLVGRMIGWAGDVGLRWVTMVRAYEHLAKSATTIANTVLSAAEALDLAQMPTADRITLAEYLRGVAARHREFSDAEWALSADDISRLEQLYDRAKPENPEDQNLWLFNNWPDLPGDRDLTLEEQERRIATFRGNAIRKILQRGGLDAICRFAERVEMPKVVGLTLFEVGIDAESEASFIDRTLRVMPTPTSVPKLLQAGLCYVSCRFRSGGTDWLRRIRDDRRVGWDTNRLANLGWALPTNGEAWDLIEGFGHEAEAVYWKRVPVGYLDRNGGDVRTSRAAPSSRRPPSSCDPRRWPFDST